MPATRASTTATTPTTDRVLRKRPAPPPVTPSKTRAAKRIKVVYSDTESSSDEEDDASDYEQDSAETLLDKENAPVPVTPRSQRVARRASQGTPTTGRRPRLSSASAKSSPTKASPTKGATRKLALLALKNSTNAPDSDTSDSDDSNPFLDTPNTSVEADTPPSSPVKPERDLTPFARARIALRADSSSAPLTSRDDERRQLLAYLRGSTAKSLYISGGPGTGKTALIREVLKAYPYPHEQDDDANEDDEDVLKVYVNCVGRKEEDVWDLILESTKEATRFKRSPKKKAVSSKDDSRSAFEQMLQGTDSRCFLVLDEIDHLSPSVGVLASVFSLPSSHSSLRVVAISNSHTLAARSRDVATLHFAPYDAKAMAGIARARLGDEATTFGGPSIMLAANRTAGVTGDVRALVALLLRTLDIAERANKSIAGAADVQEAFTSLKLQAPKKVAPAVEASKTSAVVIPAKVATGPAAGLALQPKLALLALMVSKKRKTTGLGLGLMPSATAFAPSSPTKRSGFQRTSSFGTPSRRGMARSSSFGSPSKRKEEGMDASTLHAFYSAIVSRSSPLTPVSRTEFVDVLAVLESCGAAHGYGAFEVAEGVHVEDVLQCEADSGAEAGILQALWHKETRKIENEITQQERDRDLAMDL